MVASVISFPINMQDGSFTKTEQGSDLWKGQQVTSFVKTELGERPLFDQFGITDPSFDRFDVEGFTERFVLFYNSDTIKLTDIGLAEIGGTIAEIDIHFE